MTAQKQSAVSQVELLTLRALNANNVHAALGYSVEKIAQSNDLLTPERLYPQLDRMYRVGLIYRRQFADMNVLWGLTNAGQARLSELEGILSREKLDAEAARLEDAIRTREVVAASLVERVEGFLDQRPNNFCKSEEMVGHDNVVTLCLTERALDVWWDSLTAECKGEVFSEFSEAKAELMQDLEVANG